MFSFRISRLDLYSRALPSLVLVLLATSCSTTGYQVHEEAAPVAARWEATRIYFYPKQGQSPEQQDRDQYACYLWAVRQSGFDPSVAQLAPHQRVELVPEPPPGASVAAGAVTGAVAGSVLAGGGSREEGAVFGAIAGAMIGAAIDADREAQAQKMTQQVNAEQNARIELLARDYRRAMTACLEGRGYAVH